MAGATDNPVANPTGLSDAEHGAVEQVDEALVEEEQATSDSSRFFPYDIHRNYK